MIVSNATFVYQCNKSRFAVLKIITKLKFDLIFFF